MTEWRRRARHCCWKRSPPCAQEPLCAGRRLSLIPIPLSFTHTPDGKLLKVVAARRARLSGSCGAPGTVLSLDTAQDGGIEVACGEGSLLLTRVVPEGKAPMSAADYIRGRRLSVGERLG